MRHSEKKNLLGAAWVVGLATVASRLTGLLRDSVMAFAFGAGVAADAFYAAFRIPNLMRQLFGEGALSASFVPVYTDILHRKGEEAARRFFSEILTLLAFLLALISLLGTVFAPLVVRVIAWGFPPGSEAYRLTVLLTRWMFPYLFLVCLAALSMGVLNARNHFWTPAVAPVLLNLSMVGFALFVAPGMGIPVVAAAWGVLVGGALQMALQWPSMASRGLLPVPHRGPFSPEVKRLALLMGPAAIGVTVYQVNMLVDTLLASFLPQGSITYLWYGNRLMQFPLGVFGIALATAALPTLSAQFSEGRMADFSGTVSFSLRLTAFIGFPATLGLVALREPIMAVLFGRGAFGPEDVGGAATALLYYSLGLPFYIGVKIVGRAFFAMEDSRTPVRAAVLALLSNVLLNLALMGPLLHGGLALATSLSSLLNFGVLAFLFTRRAGPGWLSEGFLPEVGKGLLASTVMFFACGALASRFSWMELPIGPRLAGLAGCLTLGCVVYIGASLALRSESMAAVAKRARSSLTRRSRPT